MMFFNIILNLFINKLTEFNLCWILRQIEYIHDWNSVENVLNYLLYTLFDWYCVNIRFESHHYDIGKNI